MDASHWFVALLGAVAGALPLLAKAIVDVLRGRSSISLDERRALFEEAQKIRADLMAEIVTTRDRVISLQEKNLELAVENAELRVTARELHEELLRLQGTVDRLQRRLGESDK